MTEPTTETPNPKAVDNSNMLTALMAFEAGEADVETVVRLFSHLVKTELAWTLQGTYGRTAVDLIENGWIDREGNVDEDRLAEFQDGVDE